MQIMTIVGARPQFIKAAAVSRILRATPGLSETLVHTGQHYDVAMSEIFFTELGIPHPEHLLAVGSGPHGAQTGRMLEAIEALLIATPPDAVLVYGDTNSTLAGALAAAKLGIPLAHVEAGLRSFNRRMPEEINRVLTDQLADWLFTPTPAAEAHLRHENHPAARIIPVGDVMYDAACTFGPEAAQRSRILETLGLPAGGYLLATVHRAENTDVPARLQAILGGLAVIAAQMPVVLPLHPRTRGRLSGLKSLLAPLRVIEPVGYLDMLRLEQGARLVVTDSGGVQKEAFFQRIPCVVVRNETEWSELVELGWNRLTPPRSADAVAAAITDMLAAPAPPTPPADLYGGGRAALRIAHALLAGPPAGASAAE